MHLAVDGPFDVQYPPASRIVHEHDDAELRLALFDDVDFGRISAVQLPGAAEIGLAGGAYASGGQAKKR
jgi:pyridoxine 5'-phosphate synthase PdxJ